MRPIHILLTIPILIAEAHAGPRGSNNYTILADSLDSAGGPAASANYTNTGSAGGAGGSADAANPPTSARSGYIGELYEVTSLLVNAAALTVNETDGVQLGAWQFLDDQSLITLPATDVTWSIDSGPLTDISANGFATSGPVAQDTPAVVDASFGGFSGSLQLTVLDTIPDNFGSYAGDGISDAWQVQYFGVDNPLAAPGVDADGDGQDNLLEFLAGSAPNDPGSQFTTSGTAVGGGIFSMQLSRVQPGTRYIFERSTDFVNWTEVFTLDPADVATPFTQPLPTNGPRDFFRVRLEPAP